MAASQLLSKIDNYVRAEMNKGEEMSFALNEYSEEDLFMLRDYFVNSHLLDGYIEVIEDKPLISIKIKRI
ncbi:hypothetical protein LJQ78_002421 [Acinetobacter baumannii]|nr:hypothetical protein [Acinetobacter baumannii]